MYDRLVFGFHIQVRRKQQSGGIIFLGNNGLQIQKDKKTAKNILFYIHNQGGQLKEIKLNQGRGGIVSYPDSQKVHQRSRLCAQIHYLALFRSFLQIRQLNQSRSI